MLKRRPCFLAAVNRLKEKWSNLERSFIAQSSSPQFYEWFCKYKMNDIIDCVIPSVRKQVGVEGHFTTNASESINNVIKQEVQWKESKLPVVIEHLKNIVARHSSEMEKAVVGRGEWSFLSRYAHLKISDSHWFSTMSHDAKQAHMKKVHTCRVDPETPPSTDDGPSASDSSTDSMSLSVQVEEVNLEAISKSTLSGIWKKAEQLVGKRDEYLLEVPWITDKKARLVKSFSSPNPHLVIQDSKSLLYQCDKNCEMFKGFHVCSHTVAVAEINGELDHLVRNLATTTPNLTTIAMRGLPSGSGRKGGQEKRKKRGKENVTTRSVRQCLNPSASGSDTTDKVHQVHSTSQPCTRVPSSVSEQLQTIDSSDKVRSVAFSNYRGQVTVSNGGFLTIASNVVNSVPSTCSNLSRSPSVSTPLVQASGDGTIPGVPSNPFILKLITRQIKVCQSCRNNYEGPNDTLGMVVARAEKRMIINPTTGVQFWTKESNSHYHASLQCITKACPTFNTRDLVISDEVKSCLTVVQKFYLWQFLRSKSCD